MNNKKKKGFTLYESIIAIVFISICSMPILSVYITAGNLNNEARNLDIGTTVASNYIEIARGASSTESFINTNIFDTAMVREDGDNTTIYQLFDENWNRLESLDKDVTDLKNISANTEFIMTIDISKINDLPNYVSYFSKDEIYLNSDEYYNIDVTLNYLGDENVFGEEMINLNTSRYFVNGEVSYEN